jgi:hypothetical protein
MIHLEQLDKKQVILNYPGYKGINSHCSAAVKGNLVLVSEAADNPGTSVRDAIEIIATRVIEEFAISPDQLQLIEAVSGDPVQYLLVSLTPGDTYMHIQRVKFVGASWTSLTPAEVDQMISQQND